MRRTNTVLSCVVLSLFHLLSSYSSIFAQQRIYLFSQDAKFLELDPARPDITDVGNLWWLGIPEVDDSISNDLTNEVLIIAKIWKLLKVEDPSKEMFETRGLVILRRALKGGLLLHAFIPPPEAGYSLEAGKVLGISEAVLFLTWKRSTKEGVEYIVTVHDSRYRLIKTIRGSTVRDRSCVSAATGRIFTPVLGEPLKIQTLDYASEAVGSLSIPRVGSETYFSKTPVASRGCKVLIQERGSRESRESQLYLYDFERMVLLSALRLGFFADFWLVDEKRLILADEKQYVPIVSQKGERVGLEVNKEGRLHVVSYTGETVGSVEVPKGGRVAALTNNGSEVIYSAPGSVAIVNLSNLSSRTLRIPFAQFCASVWNAR